MPNKSTLLPTLFILSTIFVFSSCTQYRYIYAPATPNQPLFTQKGDTKLAGYYSTSGDGNMLTPDYCNGYDVQAAYALSNHWSVTASYFNRKEESYFTNKNETPAFSNAAYKRNITDVGIGYYTPLTKDKKWFFSLYGQYGFGRFSFTDAVAYDTIVYSRFYSNRINKWGLQPAFYFKGNQNKRINFSTAFILKYSFVHYAGTSTSYTNNEIDYFNLNRLLNKTITYFEPTWKLQFGIRECNWLSLDINFTLCTQPFGPGDRLKSRDYNNSIGFTMDLGKLGSNKNNR